MTDTAHQHQAATRPASAPIIGKPVLLLVDIQQGALMPGLDTGIPTTSGVRERVSRVRTLVDCARASGVPLIYVQEAHRRDMVDFGRELDGTEGVHCLEGDPATEIADCIDFRPTDYFIRKRRYSCFFGTDLEILLKGLGISTIVMVGGLTDVCIHYTFVDGHQHDYHCRVVRDCVGGSSIAAHESALMAMRYLQEGALLSADTITEAFIQWGRGT